MNEELVPQDVVTALMIAIAHQRSILLTFRFHSRDVINKVEAVVELLTGRDSPNNVVACTPDITWPVLAAKLAGCAGSAVVLRKIERLNRDVQMHLGYTLMQRPDKEPAAVVVGTTVHPPERMHPTLRKLLLLKQDVDLSNEQLVMVEMPAVTTDAMREKMLARVRDGVGRVTIVPELQRYMEDIVLFVRAHRLVRGGLAPQAVRDFHLVVRTLCVLHEQRFATPIIIKRAARLVLPLKLRFVSPEDEPSLQYGGDLDTVKVWMRQWDGDVLVESVLGEVPVPS